MCEKKSEKKNTELHSIYDYTIIIIVINFRMKILWAKMNTKELTTINQNELDILQK